MHSHQIKVNRFTRSGEHGKGIQCPKCNECFNVYHFAWSALTCQSCNTSVDKYDWWLV